MHKECLILDAIAADRQVHYPQGARRFDAVSCVARRKRATIRSISLRIRRTLEKRRVRSQEIDTHRAALRFRKLASMLIALPPNLDLSIFVNNLKTTNSRL
jgi:hypothetical protein